jgi:hypothetical protein
MRLLLCLALNQLFEKALSVLCFRKEADNIAPGSMLETIFAVVLGAIAVGRE